MINCAPLLITLPLACWLAHPFVLHGAEAPPSAEAVPPLVRAHSHNDYEHKRPLFDALDHGFCSVEADVHLVDGQLLVAHDRSQVKPGWNLQSLYLDPLRQRARTNGGRIHPNGPTIVLLIDVKSDAHQTYLALREVLKTYEDVLTVFRSGAVKTNAVTAILSGNRARDLLAGEVVRYAALDGRLEDLEEDAPNTLIPLVSDSWTARFKWRGLGPMDPAEQTRLRETVRKAHAQGRVIRFWGTPETPAFWSELDLAGVDLLGADDLGKLHDYLLKSTPERRTRDRRETSD